MGNRSGGIIHKLKHPTTFKRSSSKTGSTKESETAADFSHLETFLLVWVDPHIDESKENQATQKRLRKILTCLVTFDNVDSCEQWLKKCCTDEKIILIVSGAFGKEIVPRIHHLQSIVTIYVYCLDIPRNKLWAEGYHKIRGIKAATDDLIQALSEDHVNLESVEDSKALQIYEREQQIYSVDRKTASFLWFQLLLEMLYVPSYLQSKATRNELVDILRQYSSDDESGSELIDRFVQLYEPRKAAAWLTYDTPLARFVNKVLREQDIKMLFTLRFLLSDIYKQLLDHQEQSLHVFKLQLMSRSEMENLKANPGQLVIINGFLFASTHMSRLISMVTSNDQFETVLFDIKADRHSGTAPFAFVRNLDSNATKSIDREVLFMCGSIFKVGPLLYEDNVWKLQLTLAGEDDSSVSSNVKHDFRENRNLSIIGDLLSRCDQEEKATIFYQRLFNELPKEHPLAGHVNKQLSVQSRKASISLNHDVSFVLLNLSGHMTEFASTTLKTLCTLTTSQLISVVDDSAIVSIAHWPRKTTLLFTTRKSASALGKLPDYFKLFVFDESNGHSQNDQQRFSTVDELICRLVDEVVQEYRSEASDYAQLGDTIKAKQKNERASRIYRELRKLHAPKSTVDNLSIDISNRMPPILIWLCLTLKVDQKGVNYINNHFSSYFSSIKIVDDAADSDMSSLLKDDSRDIFLIVQEDDGKSVEKGLYGFPTVKYVYQYDEAEEAKKQDNLSYRLTCDLIHYHKELGEQYRARNQKQKAREMFSKAKNLCHWIASECFSTD